jgi:2-oxo-4-hydroxy-4-carboxy--5-ureidoimidazoline (OHCU) decarboxylase
VYINYLQFLNKPALDEDSQLWFFTYLSPESEEIKRVEDIQKIRLTNKYKAIKRGLFLLNKKRKIKVKTEFKSKNLKSNAFDFKDKNKEKTKKNKLLTKEIATRALELKVNGFDKKEIICKLTEIYNIPSIIAEIAATKCYIDLSKDVDEDFIRFTVLNHSLLYDELYRKFLELGAPKIAMRALKSKETLNDVGQDIFDIQVNNIFEDQKDIVSYGLKKLTDDEQKEFVNILNRINTINEQKQNRLNSA